MKKKTSAKIEKSKNQFKISDSVIVKNNNKKRGKIIGFSSKGKIIVEMSKYSVSVAKAKEIEHFDKDALELVDKGHDANNKIIAKKLKDLCKHIEEADKLCKENKTSLEEILLTESDDSTYETFAKIEINWNCPSCGTSDKSERCNINTSTCIGCCGNCYECGDCGNHGVEDDYCNDCECNNCCCQCETPEERERAALL